MSIRLGRPTVESPQSSVEHKSTLSETLVRWCGRAAIGAATAATAYGTYRSGDFDSLQAIFTDHIQPNVIQVPEAVDGMVVFNNSMRVAAPSVMAGGLSAIAIDKYRAYRGSRPGASLAAQQAADIELMSGLDYSGTQQFGEGRKDRIKRALGQTTKGMGLAVVAAAAIGGSSGLEHELVEGPIRPIVTTFDELTPGHTGERVVIVNSPENSFMDTSVVDATALRLAMQEMYADGATAIPFSKELPNVNGRSGLVTSIPDQAFVRATGEQPHADCAEPLVILDEATGIKKGGTVSVNGLEAHVAKTQTGIGMIQRDIAIMPQTDFDNCLLGTKDPKYYGALVTGMDKGQVNDILAKDHLDGKAVAITEGQFLDNNRNFWRGNGTPLVLVIESITAGLGAIGIARAKKESLQRSVKNIATLNASGVSMDIISKIETSRAVKEAAKATALAAPLMVGVAGVFNTVVRGLEVGVGLTEIAAGYVVTLGASVYGARRAVRSFKKNKLNETLKG